MYIYIHMYICMNCNVYMCISITIYMILCKYIYICIYIYILALFFTYICVSIRIRRFQSATMMDKAKHLTYQVLQRLHAQLDTVVMALARLVVVMHTRQRRFRVSCGPAVLNT